MTEGFGLELPPEAQKATEHDRRGKMWTMGIYAAYAIGFLLGTIPIVIGLAFAYIKREDHADSIYAAHMTYLIRTFWWLILWFVIGFVTLFFMVGAIILLAASGWLIYRLIRGFVRLDRGQLPHTMQEKAA